MNTQITETTETEIKTSTKNRIYIIDALRGFSLLGIILAHTTYAFLEYTAAPTSYDDPGNLSLLDRAAKTFVQVFVSGKFYIIFSILFGLSFSIQMHNAQSKNESFIPRFTWRLVLLFIIGYLHSFVFSGGILQDYALLGMVLLLFSTLSNEKALAMSILLFIANIFVVILKPELSVFVDPAMKAASSSFAGNFMNFEKIGFNLLYGRFILILSLFTLGLYIGKKKLIQDILENDVYTKRIMIWSAIITFVLALCAGLISFSSFKENPIAEYISRPVIYLQKISLSVFYIGCFIKLYNIPSIHQLLKWFVPIGKMGLTNYIVQSFFLAGYYALAPETLNKIGLAASVGITTLFFAAQVLYSLWWMSLFQYGPIEWLWRSLIYFKPQPLLKKA